MIDIITQVSTKTCGFIYSTHSLEGMGLYPSILHKFDYKSQGVILVICEHKDATPEPTYSVSFRGSNTDKITFPEFKECWEYLKGCDLSLLTLPAKSQIEAERMKKDGAKL
jgi:hypothetical protein